MLNKIVHVTFSTWWMGYLFVVNQLEVFNLFQMYVPAAGFVSTFASVGTIGILMLYFFLLTFKVLVPLTYFVLSFSFYFKMISLGLTSGFVYFSIAFWSLYGLEPYLFVLQKKLYWLLYLVYGEVRTLGFLLELVMVTVKPIFSSKMLESGDTSFSSDQPYQEKAKQLFDLTLQPLKVGYGYVSEKVEEIFDTYQEYQKQQQQQQQQQQRQKVVIVEEPVIQNETVKMMMTTSPCFLFEVEMQNVFGNPVCIENEDITVMHVPLHGVGGLLLLGLRCLMKK